MAHGAISLLRGPQQVCVLGSKFRPPGLTISETTHFCIFWAYCGHLRLHAVCADANFIAPCLLVIHLTVWFFCICSRAGLWRHAHLSVADHPAHLSWFGWLLPLLWAILCALRCVSHIHASGWGRAGFGAAIVLGPPEGQHCKLQAEVGGCRAVGCGSSGDC